jgi:hypothetical protein
MSLYFGYGVDSTAKIEMNGDQNKSIVQQSAGLHLIEVNNSGGCKGNWSYAEYSVVVLVFVFILKCSHLCHYCFVTKSLVKKKVTHEMGKQMNVLNKQPDGRTNPPFILEIFLETGVKSDGRAYTLFSREISGETDAFKCLK